MASNKRSLSLPAAARRASKKSTRQVVPHESQPQADEEDRQLLAQLIAAEPGAEVGVDAEADEPAAAGPVPAADLAHAAPEPTAQETAADGLAQADEMTVLQVDSHVQHEDDLMQDAEAPHQQQHTQQQEQQQQKQQQQEEQHLQAAPSLMTVSDYTLVQHAPAPAAVASPTVGTGRCSKRACSNKAKQIMAALEHDTDGEDASPAPKSRASKKKPQEDADFEAHEPSSSSSEDEGDAPSDDEDFGIDSDDDDRPKKKAQKGAATKKGPAKAAAKLRASTGSVAAPKSGRGSAKGSARTAQASAAGGASGAGRKPSSKAASGKGTAAASSKAAAGSGQGAASARAAASGKAATAAGSSMPAPAARQAFTSPAVPVGGGAISGSSCAVGGARSGQKAAKSAVARPPIDASPAVGQSRTPLAQLPPVPAAGAASAVECESGGQASCVDIGRAVTAISGAGAVQPATSTASHHGPGVCRKRHTGAAAAESSPGSAAPSTASPSSKGNSISSNSRGLSASKKQSSVRTGGRLGLGLSSSAGAGVNGSIGNGLSIGSMGGSSMGGMLGGAAFRVPGLRRPGPKRPVTPQ